tara:strand:+ start:192 stop:722 length:531 start_codon:yes stop_codon:yes gene_type:complete
MKNRIAILLVFLIIACKSKQNESVVNLINYEYENVSFIAPEYWKPYFVEKGLISFKNEKSKNDSYNSNFTIITFADDSVAINKDIDQLVRKNMLELNEVYAKFKVVRYDTIKNASYKGRKVSLTAITPQQDTIGSLIYFLNNGERLTIASFQGLNHNGSFKNLTPELGNIAMSIKF